MAKKIAKFLVNVLDFLPVFLFACSIIVLLFSMYSSVWKADESLRETGQFALGFMLGFMINYDARW